MRLKRGKSSYRLPSDFAELIGVQLRRKRNWYLLCATEADYTKAKGNNAILELPNYISMQQGKYTWLVFYPAPDKAYYCNVNYLAFHL